MATHSSILAWRIPWTEEPGRLQSIWSQRVGHDWSNLTCLWCMLPYLSVALSLSTYNKGNKWSVCPQLSVLSHHESPSSWRSWFSLYFLCTINGILFEGRDSTGWISLHNITAMHLIFHIMKMQKVIFIVCISLLKILYVMKQFVHRKISTKVLFPSVIFSLC